MAEIDEKKIYSKFVERMQNLTANGEEGIVLDALSHGKNTYLRMDRLESSDFDLSWIDKIEEVLYDLGEIIKAPRLTTKQVADLAPVELARKTTSVSIQHLASHTQYVKEIDDYGNVIPSKVLNIANEDEIFTYENRFIATFIRKLVLFIEKRYEFAKAFASLHDEEVLYMKNKSRMGKTDIEIETKVRVSTETESLMAQKHNEAFARIEEIRRYVTYYYGSPFMKAFKTDHNVRNPIVKTNILRKNVKYKHCYDVYRYIESYTRLGVKFRVEERYSDLTEAEMAKLNYAFFSSYLAVQGQTKSVHGKTFAREYKPRILSSLDDESFVYGNYLKGPVSFVRIDEGYRQYLETLRYKNLPERPSAAEREYYAQELEQGRDLKQFDREVAALLRRKEKEAERFEKHAQKIIEERELARIKLQEAQEEIAAQQEEDMLNKIRAEIVRSARASFGYGYEGFDQTGEKLEIPPQDERPNEVRPTFIPNQSRFDVDSVELDEKEKPSAFVNEFPQILGEQQEKPVEPAPFIAPAPVEAPAESEGEKGGLSLDDYERLTFVQKYDRADPELKEAYMALRRHALSYGLHSRLSNSCDTYKLTGENRGVYLKLTIVGKTIKAYYNLDPKAYEGSTIPFEDASKKKSYAEVPFLFRVRSGLSLRRALKLIDDMMEPLGIVPHEVSEEELALPRDDEANRIAPPPLPIPEQAAIPVTEPEQNEPVEEPLPESLIQAAQEAKTESVPEFEPYIEPEPLPIVAPIEEEPVQAVPTMPAGSALDAYERQPFLTKFANADEDLKAAYMEIRKEALSYGLRSRFSNFGDTYKLNGANKGVYLKLNIVGKTLRAYYKLDPKAYEGSTIPFEDASDKKMYAEVPFLFRVRSGLSVRRAIKLLEDMLDPLGLTKRAVNEDELAVPAEENAPVEEKKAPVIVPDIQPEPVIEPEPVPQPEPEPELIPEPVSLPVEPMGEESVEEAEAPSQGGFAALANIERQSFEEKFEKADDDIKDAYNQIKEAALGFGLRSRISNFGDTFKLNGEHKGIYLKLNIVGKTLRAYFRLNPKDYEDTTIPFEDASDKKMYAETPLLLRVRSGLSLRRALKLLEDMMNDVLGKDEQ